MPQRPEINAVPRSFSIGKLIGRQGRTAGAGRTLFRGASAKEMKRTELETIE